MTQDELLDILKASGGAALSGAATGGLFGAGGKILLGGKKLKDVLRAAGAGASVYGGASGGSTLLGSALLGAPKKREANPFTERGTVGGAVGGGILGAIGGAALGAGKAPMWVRRLTRNPKNILTQKLYEMARAPSLKNALVGAGVGAAGLGGAGAFIGSDEGMQTDFLRAKLKEQKHKDLLAMVGL